MSSPFPTCPSDHHLRVDACHSGLYATGWSCDGCGESFTPGLRWRCQQGCSYDMCFHCIDPARSSPRGSCGAGHPLGLSDESRGGYASGWVCDLCRVHLSPGWRWRCASCQYDACDPCAGALPPLSIIEPSSIDLQQQQQPVSSMERPRSAFEQQPSEPLCSDEARISSSFQHTISSSDLILPPFPSPSLTPPSPSLAPASDSTPSSSDEFLASHRILLLYHSEDAPFVTLIMEPLEGLHMIAHMTQGLPAEIQARASAIQWCSVAIVFPSMWLQRDPFLMESCNYVRAQRKCIISIIAQPDYTPFGALGAICLADSPFIPCSLEPTYQRSQVVQILSALPSPAAPAVPYNPAAGDALPALPPFPTSPELFQRRIFLSTAGDAAAAVEVVESAVAQVGSATLTSEPSELDQCGLVVCVLTEEYARSERCQEHINRARQQGKFMIPIIGERGFEMKVNNQGWLSLAIAGHLFYVLPDHKTAMKPVYDSCAHQRFASAVEAYLANPPSEHLRAQARLAALLVEAGELKEQLGHWPPTVANTPECLTASTSSGPVFSTEPPAAGSSSTPMRFIHYKVMRQSFKPPPPLFDARGVAQRRRFDVMLSYNWGIQEFVRAFFMDMHMTQLDVWLDVWGGMQGNINDAMATAVECSAVLLCFITDKYQESPNCLLEIKYALFRRKPLVLIFPDKSQPIIPLLADLLAPYPRFYLKSIDDCSKLINGLPQFFSIVELIRSLIKLNPLSTDEYYSPEERCLQRLIHGARCEIATATMQARWSQCTRCQALFDASSALGCKRHSAYYMGGTLIAGRWICCQQRDKAAFGCDPCDHTTSQVRWGAIPGHSGCYRFDESSC